MTYDACWPKKRGRPRKKTFKDRLEEVRQEKLCLAEKAEPLTDFDMAAKIEGLWSRKR